MSDHDDTDNSIPGIIEFITEEDNGKIDLAMSLELADRINSNKQECKEAVQALIKRLSSSNSNIKKNTIDLLETLVKNCNQRFQYEISNKKFCDLALKILKRRRGKSNGLFGKLLPDKNENLAYVEKKLLYLIQLWADTFMMHEDEFKSIMECYRQLRKEGVQFPPRDPNEKFMINFKGIVSPVFLVMENNNTNDCSNGSNTSKTKTKESNKSNTVPEKVAEKAREEEKEIELINDEIYYASHEGTDISAEEVEILKGSMGILKEICENASTLDDMNNEIATEILDDLLEVQKKLTRVIKMEKMIKPHQRRILFELDFEINESVALYKSKYAYFKENSKRGLSSSGSKPKKSARGNISDRPIQYDKQVNKEINDKDKKASSIALQKNPEIQKIPNEKQVSNNEKPKSIVKKVEAYPGSDKIKRIIAPPPGWKKPSTTTEDLLDMFTDTNRDNNKKSSSNHTAQLDNTTTKVNNAIDDILSMNFSTAFASSDTTNIVNQTAKYPISLSTSYNIANPITISNTSQMAKSEVIGNGKSTDFNFNIGQGAHFHNQSNQNIGDFSWSNSENFTKQFLSSSQEQSSVSRPNQLLSNDNKSSNGLNPIDMFQNIFANNTQQHQFQSNPQPYPMFDMALSAPKRLQADGYFGSISNFLDQNSAREKTFSPNLKEQDIVIKDKLNNGNLPINNNQQTSLDNNKIKLTNNNEQVINIEFNARNLQLTKVERNENIDDLF